MKKIIFALLLLFVISSCAQKEETTPAQQNKPLTSYVNTFIGTGGHGHTYPGATMPFGMVQLSPDTRLDGWDGCSGYHYSDTYIYGFSHTHLSGTGVSDYGDILLMPTNAINFNNGADGKKGYGSTFSHDTEEASPGYYKVHLDDTNIDVALTVTKRAAMHKYQFPSADNQVVILDLIHRDKVLDAKIEIVSDTEIQGFRHSEAWATDQRLFFSIKTSHPFNDMLQSPLATGMPGARRDAMQFINPNNEPVYISVGISAVDIAGAKKNRETEIGSKTFRQIKKEATLVWEHQLQKIVVEDTNQDHLTNFYSAMYHSMIAPNLYQDVDGRYRGMDLEIHETQDFDYYTVFSLWDTYRAAHPLYTIIEQERTNDFINTFLAKYDEGGIMPIWDLSANYTGCMIGYHAVPVIADAYLKGIADYDANKALKAMMHSAMQDKLGLASYKELGFVPVEVESESVSKTLEYAYDDWTIAQMANKMGYKDAYKQYSERGQYYKNMYNPSTGFMQGRFNNTWFGPFDPYEVNFNYTEANAWQYSMYAPQDISGLMQLMGGKEKLAQHLDNLFTAKEEVSGRNQADITGLIGQYVHGNEPSHHMAYLYNFVNEPSNTQRIVRKVLTELYTNAPDGVSGNEDCGQMSAWYIFSSLGFYPVTPGSNQYIIGSPLFEKATINLENGKQFTVQAKDVSAENFYIKSGSLNGEVLDRTYLYHAEIVAGGTLVFEMTNSPSDWGTKDSQIPRTEIKEHQILLTPFIASGKVAFKNKTTITLGVADVDASIYYSIDEGAFAKYEAPIIISEAVLIKTYAEKGGKKSGVLSTQLFKIDPTMQIALGTAYANEYSASGKDALIDGIKGARDFRTGAWQGYSDLDLDAVVSLGKQKDISEIKINFLQDQRSWIFYPTEVECWISTDGENYSAIGVQKIDAANPDEEILIKTISFKTSLKAAYVKIKAKNLGPVPSWHLGSPFGGKAWIFADEIEIK
jgi:predicted alpha-1,2-mannosidase